MLTFKTAIWSFITLTLYTGFMVTVLDELGMLNYSEKRIKSMSTDEIVKRYFQAKYSEDTAKKLEREQRHRFMGKYNDHHELFVDSFIPF